MNSIIFAHLKVYPHSLNKIFLPAVTMRPTTGPILIRTAAKSSFRPTAPTLLTTLTLTTQISIASFCFHLNSMPVYERHLRHSSLRNTQARPVTTNGSLGTAEGLIWTADCIRERTAAVGVGISGTAGVSGVTGRAVRTNQRRKSRFNWRRLQFACCLFSAPFNAVVGLRDTVALLSVAFGVFRTAVELVRAADSLRDGTAAIGPVRHRATGAFARAEGATVWADYWVDRLWSNAGAISK